MRSTERTHAALVRTLSRGTHPAPQVTCGQKRVVFASLWDANATLAAIKTAWRASVAASRRADVSEDSEGGGDVTPSAAAAASTPQPLGAAAVAPRAPKRAALPPPCAPPSPLGGGSSSGLLPVAVLPGCAPPPPPCFSLLHAVRFDITAAQLFDKCFAARAHAPNGFLYWMN